MVTRQLNDPPYPLHNYKDLFHLYYNSEKWYFDLDSTIVSKKLWIAHWLHDIIYHTFNSGSILFYTYAVRQHYSFCYKYLQKICKYFNKSKMINDTNIYFVLFKIFCCKTRPTYENITRKPTSFYYTMFSVYEKFYCHLYDFTKIILENTPKIDCRKESMCVCMNK